MICNSCGRDIPFGSCFCCWCGADQLKDPTKKTRRVKRRGNGQGTAYKRGRSWTGVARRMRGADTVTRTKGGFSTKAAALEWATNALKAPRTAPSIVLEDLYSQWIDRHRTRVTRSTVQCYEAAWKYFDAIRFERFAELTTEQLQDCVDRCPHGIRTRENMKALMTSLYKYGHELGISSEDYAQHIFIRRDEAPKEKRTFTPQELRILFDHADSVPFVDIVLVLCYTGYRINELLSMPRAAYDPAQRTLVGGSKTEAGRNRLVPVADCVRPFVERYYRSAHADGRLFHENGKRITTNHFRDLMSRALGAVPGVRQLTPHECRHTFATMLKSTTANTVDKKRLVGHTSEQMLEHYTHSDIAALRSIIDQL